MTCSFAWNGMLLGLISLYMVHRIVRDRAGFWAGWGVAAAALALGSFGISMGRFQRFNSWDLFTNPDDLLRRVGSQLAHPFTPLLPLAMAMLFFAFLSLAYL